MQTADSLLAFPSHTLQNEDIKLPAIQMLSKNILLYVK